MAENRRPDEGLMRVAQELIREDERLADIAASGVRIAYLLSDAAPKSRGRPCLGKCERVPARFRWAVPYDFTVTLFEPNCALLTDGQRRLVVLHELLHVGVEATEDGYRYSVRPHDVEDFEFMLGRYGMGWARPGAPDGEAGAQPLPPGD